MQPPTLVALLWSCWGQSGCVRTTCRHFAPFSNARQLASIQAPTLHRLLRQPANEQA